MKKLIFTALLGVSVFLMACESGKSVYQVWTISSIESENVASATISARSFVYSDLKGHSSESGGAYTDLPRVVEQKITGDTISRITYSYGAQTITTRAYVSRPGADVIVDSLQYNNSGMAATQLMADGTSKPYYIKYDGAARMSVGDLQLEVMSRNYVRVMDASKNIVTDYYYTNYPNYIGIQQQTILGDPYHWPTDRFGAQSNNLLEKSVVYENGKAITYEFEYQFDLRGFVVSEKIRRDKVLIAKNKYTYKMGLIER